MRQYPGFRRSLLKARKSSTSTIAFTTALTIGINSGHAQTVIESSNQSQTLSTDTAYVVNFGTEVSDKKDDAIIVNGIAPVTVTNAGTLVGGQKVFVERKQEPAAGIRFNVDGSLINQASGVIVGDDRGVFMNSAGTINNITNFGEITGSKGPAIEYGPNSSGTIDNFGTIANGASGLLFTGSSRGIGIDSTGTVTVINHAGAVIRSDPGPSPDGIVVSAGSHVLTNQGLIEANGRGIRVTDGNVRITNSGTITSRTGTAISLESRDNFLTLDTGSILNGFATSTGADNHLRLQGSGIEDSPITGFADLTMAGTAWTLSGAVSTTGTAANTIDIQTGALTVSGALSTGNGGGATIASGAGLIIGAGGDSGSFAGHIVDNGTLTLQRSDDVLFPNIVSGTGSLVKVSAGTATLGGANSYSGGTRLEGGVLSVLSDTSLGNAVGGLTFFGGTLQTPDDFVTARTVLIGDSGGTIDTAGSGAKFTGLISGVASLVKTNEGGLTLTADNTDYTGTLTIESGAVALGNGGATGTIAGNVINFGSLSFNRVTDLSFGGSIAGSGNIVKQGSNRLTLSGDVSSTTAIPAAIDVWAGELMVTGTLATGDDGATTVQNGASLAIGNGGLTGDLVGDVVNLGSVVFDRANDLAYRESIIGPGTVAKQGAGTFTLLGNIASSSGVTIGGGVLQLGDDGEVGAIAGNIFNNAALTFNRSDSYEQGGVISGSGSVTQQGAGRTTLSGINSYSGLTRVDAGRLDITGSVVGSVEVAAGATLGGIGAVGGQVSIADGAHLTPGVSIGTLTLGSLMLNPGSQLDYQLGIPGILGATNSDHIGIGGALTLDGTLNITDVGGFSQGVYQLMGYGGALTNNGLQVGGIPPRFRSTGFMTISTATPGEVNLIVSGGGFGLQFWDGPNTVGNGVIEGGTATWRNSSTNWTLPDQSSNAPWQGGFAIFQGTPGTVTLGESISFEGMQFRSDGYVIENGGFRLQRGLDTILRVDPGMTATIATEIADGSVGASTLIKEGGGTLIFDHANSYLGDTLIEAGTLRVHADANLGNPSNVVALQGGTLAVGNDFSTGRGIIFNAEGGSIEVFGPQAIFTGALTGPGAFTKTGKGELVLEGAGNSYGGTLINEGTLTVATDGLLGDPAHGVALNGGALNVGGGFTTARLITIGEGGGVLDTSGASATFTGNLTGPGPLIKGRSTNTIILTGDNDYGIGTTIRGGTLQLGNGGATGSILGHVLDNGTLTFNRSDAYQIANTIYGKGGVEITGGGIASLIGSNNYRGGTRVSDGSTLIVDFQENLGQAGVGGISMTNDSALVLTNTFSLSRPVTIEDSTQTINTSGENTVTTISTVVSGGGLLRKAGAGRLNLVDPSNSYSGGTRIDEGTLGVLADTNLGLSTSSLALGGGTLLVGDGFTTARAVTLDTGGGTIEADGAHASFNGTISGVGALSKSGSGELALGGAGNSYAGGTFINAGTLAVATDNLLGDGTGGLTLDGGTLRVGSGFTSARAVTLRDGGGIFDASLGGGIYTGKISGPGRLTRAGSNSAIILANDNDYFGGTTIESGVLQIGNGGATGSILGDVLNGGSLIFNRNDIYAIANTISGAGSLTIDGGGIATLTGNNSYTGETRIFGSPVPATAFSIGGSLVAVSNSNLGSAAGSIVLDRGGKLVLADSFDVTRSIALEGSAPVTIDTRNNIVIASGVMSGTATLIKEGIGRLIIGNTSNQTGGAVINAGTVQIGGGVGSETLNGDITIASRAALVFDLPNVVSFGSITGAGSPRQFGRVISGEGEVIQAGTGTLIATGVHDYTGTTHVESGRLLVNGTIAGAAEVAGGARLGGTGNIGGTVTVADGAILAPGASVGTLTVDSLLLGTGSLLEYELGLPDIGGGINDLINVNGALTLDGTLNIVNAGGFSRGVYRLINYGGALTDNGLQIGGLPTRFVANDMLLSTATAGQVDLIVNTGGFGLQFWDGSGTVSNGAVEGGSAIWSNITTNWTAADGLVNAPWQQGFAVFQGTAGSVTLGESIALEGMQFRTDGYVIEGGGFGLAGAPETLIRVDPAVTATLNAPIGDGSGGATRVTKTGPGLLVLGGTNTYSGGTSVEGGALQVGADANLGAASGALNLDAGTLITPTSFSSARAVTLGENGGTLATESGTQLTLTGAVGGAGTLTKTGTGTLSLSGTNSYGGGTVLGAGVLAISRDANLGAANGLLEFSGGTLRFDASFNPAASRAVVLDTSGTINTNGNIATLAQGIVGKGALIKAGAGTLTLAGNNGYAGGTTIGTGTLQIGNGGTTGTLVGDVTNNASLVFNRADSTSFGGAISGSGAFTKLGAGTLTLTGNNSYVGGTTIAAGTLRIGDGATSGSLTGNIVDNGALVFSRSDAVTFGGVVSGSGSLSQMGSGTLTLGGTNSYSGGTIARAGTIAVSSDLNLGAADTGLTLDGGNLLTTAAINSARPITLTTSGGTIDNGGFNDLFTGPIGGSGSLTVAGTGTVTLAAENDYSGGTTIAAGTLRLGNGGATGSITGNVVNNGTLTFARSNLMLFEDMISGSGAMAQTGTGKTILNASNSYLGGTSISAGTLQIGNGETSGSITGDVDNNTLLIFDRADTLTYSGVIDGPGALLLAGAGTTILTGANSYTGATTISSGTLQIGAGGTTGSIPGDVSNDGALVFNRANALAFGSTISGSGMLSQIGAGTLTLAGTNSHSGGTSVLGARLAISSDTNLGASTADLTLDGGQLVTTAGIASQRLIMLGADGGTIDNGGFTNLFAGPVTGTGALMLAGSGTATLTADNNYSGGTTIAAGTLRLGSGGTTGSLVGGIVNHGTLVFDRANALALDVAISGTGAVIQQGSGTTTLAATSSYTGLTSVNNGRLLVDGVLRGDVNVGAGARLGGIGQIDGTVTIGSGGHLAPGHSPGTMRVGALVLDAGALLDYDFGLSDIVGSGINDLTIVSGALTLDGTLNIADAGGLNRGIYRIFEYGGALTDNGLELGSVPSGFSTPDLEISTALPGEVNLIVNTGRSFGLQFWDGPNSAGNGIVEGGSGIWNAAATNWTGLSGSPNMSWQAGFAVFQGTPGAVTLGSAISFEGMQFRTSGYVIDGDGLDLTALGSPIIRVDPSLTATINAPIAGTAKLTKTGGGLLVLGGANSYAGGTAINGGTIRIASDANLGGAGGPLSLDSGTLETTASLSSSRSVTLGEDGGTFAIGTGTQLTLGGAISGTGVFGKTGSGTLNLTGTNTHTGGTFVGAGMLLVSSDANLGAATTPLALGGGTLGFDSSFDPVASRPIGLGTLGGTIDTRGNTSTFAQGIGGTGALTKQGAGTLILSGANSYSGGTTISAGSLQIGNGGTTGSLLGDINNNSALAINRADKISFAGVISGNGSLTQVGTGTTVLTGANSYTGGTLIRTGTLQIGNGGTTGSLAGDIANNGTLVFNRADTTAFAGTISGTGALRQEGSGTLTLSGANSYTGPTTVARGLLDVAGSLGNTAVTVALGATLSGGGSIKGPVTVNDGARLAPGPRAAQGTLSVAALTLKPQARLAWQLGRPNIVGGRLNDVVAVAGDLSLDGRLDITPSSGFAALPGSYRLIEYGGALTDAGLALGLLPTRFSTSQVQTVIPNQVNLIAIRDDLALQFWDSSDNLGNGQINGGAGVWNSAAANWTAPNGAINQQWVSSMGIFAGPGGDITLGEDVEAIALQFAGDGYRIEGAEHTLTFVPHAAGVGGLVRVDPEATAEIATVIDGTAGLTKADAGTLILTGANSYSGGTAIRGGTLQIGTGGTSGSINGAVENDGRLVFNRSDSVTFAGVISGLGTVEQNGGTLTLNGANSYAAGTSVRGGTLQIASDKNIGGETGALQLDSATLRWMAAFDLAAARPITLGAGGAVLNTNGFDSAVSQRIGGAGGLTKLGTGWLTLSGHSDYAGPTAVSAGELSVNGSIRSATTVEPNATLSGVGTVFGNVVNRGLIAPGNSIGTLTIAGAYSSEGGSLAIETVLGSDSSPSDRLVIAGGAATGTTAVQVLNVGGAGALTTGDGILVVDASADATTTADAFKLAAPVIAGPYEYHLQRGGSAGANPDDWFLSSALEPGTPSYRLETSLYATLPALALTYGRSLLGTFNERAGEIGGQNSQPNDEERVWIRTFGRDGDREGKNGVLGDGPRYDYDYRAVQLGIDIIRQGDENSEDVAGVYGAYGSGSGNVRHFTGAHAGEDTFDADSIGAYWTRLWSNGWYVDGVVQGSWYDLTAKSVRLPELKTDAFGFAASIEAGRTLQVGDLVIEPQVQLIRQTVSLDRVTDAAAQIRFEDTDSLAGRIGARVAKTWGQGDRNAITLWGRVNLWNEFMGNTKTEFSSAAGPVPLHADLGGEWVELNAGITAAITDRLSLHTHVAYETDFEDRQHSVEMQLGLRMSW